MWDPVCLSFLNGLREREESRKRHQLRGKDLEWVRCGMGKSNIQFQGWGGSSVVKHLLSIPRSKFNLQKYSNKISVKKSK